MQAASDSNMDVKMEIQSELMSINSVVTKIKQELYEIQDIVQTDGSLDTALRNAIDSLVLLAKEQGVVIEESTVSAQEENPMRNPLSRITTGYLAEKFQALSHH